MSGNKEIQTSSGKQEKKGEEKKEENDARKNIEMALGLDRMQRKNLKIQQEEDPARVHAFWDTQPVPKLGNS